MITIISALVVLLAFTQTAHAGIIVAAIVGAIGLTGIPAAIAIIGGTLALGFAASYLMGQLFQKDLPSLSTQTGSKLDLRADADIPRSVLFGQAVTAGSLVYAGTYGSDGPVHNSELIEIIAVADHACTSLEKVFVEGKLAVLSDSGTDKSVDGYDGKCKFKFYDGTQVTADSLTVSNLGSHPTQPWTSDAVGIGVTYVRVHCTYDQSKLSGPLAWKFVVKGIKLYDPRLDTTVGGSGSHRWGDASTYAWTENPAVIIYNICRGIYVNGDFLYGLENTDADQFPLDNWFAAMNDCDETITVLVGDPIVRYAAGGEITVDTPPMDAIREVLKTCGGTFVESGGVYKLYVDTPGLPTLEFTDESLVASKDSTFTPILGLESRVNYVTGRFMSPIKWAPVEAPVIASATLEEADGRRLPAELDANMVQDSRRMQRLMRQFLQRAQRQRRHTLTLGPGAFGVEPGQTVSWSSDQNGYTDKIFVVDKVDVEPDLSVTLAITETNPNDYDWDTSFEQPQSDGEIENNIPPVKTIAGFSATGVIRVGDKGTKKPGILLEWGDPADGDAIGVFFQYRRTALPDDVAHGEFNDPTAESGLIEGGLAPETAYEVRARFRSENGYASDWSLWIPVTTPAAYLTPKDFADQLNSVINAAVTQAGYNAGIIADDLNHKISLLTGIVDGKASKDQLIQLGDGLRSEWKSDIQVATAPLVSLVSQVTSLQASVNGLKAGLKAMFFAGVADGIATAVYQLRVTASQAGTPNRLSATAGMTVAAYKNTTTGVVTSQILFDANQILFGSYVRKDFKPALLYQSNKLILDGDLVVRSITAARAKFGSLSAISANLGEITAGKIVLQKKQSGKVVGQLEITDNPLRIMFSRLRTV